MRWPTRVTGLAYGADYNPEQWPESVWAEDVELMRRAHVNLVSVGIFSWALLEPAEGRHDFGWLDRVLDGLHAGGIAVDLATATASPPPWFSRRYPESLPVTEHGSRLWPGRRQAYCPSSPAYRTAAARLATALAERYADHPALAMWHVNNEYGCHVARCYCDVSADAFRDWLRQRYGELDALNAAWGTDFWSQRYHAWDEILPPRAAPTFANPTQQLDFRRFSSHELLACFLAERDALRRVTPDVPVTTNLMLARFEDVDYWPWGGEMDVVSNDHYLLAEDPENEIDLALGADVTRGVAAGAPWMLMEHAPSAVNWQPRNVPKHPGEMRRNSLAHVARGADAVMFFQWRASRAGAEKYHSGMVPHAGPDTRVFREAQELGADLERLAEVAGTRVVADVAILWDWEAWWGVELDSHPSVDVRYLDSVRQVHRALWRAGITADAVRPGDELDGYRLVLVPSLYLVRAAAVDVLRRAVEGGAQVVVWYFSGIVDEHDHVLLGGYPGAFRGLCGVRVEELCPLPSRGSVTLDDGRRGTLWSERMRSEGAEVLARYTGDDLDGLPAITRHAVGRGAAWYVSTRLDDGPLEALVRDAAEAAGVRPVVEDRPVTLEVVRRRGAQGSYLFALNHGGAPARIEAHGHELLSDQAVAGQLQVPPGGVAVVREA